MSKCLDNYSKAFVLEYKSPNKTFTQDQNVILPILKFEPVVCSVVVLSGKLKRKNTT